MVEDGASESIRVSVLYALPDRQSIVNLRVPQGTCVQVAVELSGLLRRFPEAAANPLNYAIFSRLVPGADVLREGDRVEILRPLLIDPKENRRQAAARARRDVGKGHA